MALTFKFFHDAALTSQITAGTPLTFSQASDGSSGPVTRAIYLGSSTASKKLQAASNPGVDQITVSVVDAAPGSGHPATEIKLSATLVGLDTAVGGDPLNLGVQISSGVSAAAIIYVRGQDSTATVGTSTELSLQTNTVKESAA